MIRNEFQIESKDEIQYYVDSDNLSVEEHSNIEPVDNMKKDKPKYYVDSDVLSVEEHSNIEPIDKVDSYCCMNKCLWLFDDKFKSCLKNDLSLLSNSEKRIYLFALISIDEEKKISESTLKSSTFFRYTVKEYGISRFVCKNAFISLHHTTRAMVRTLCVKMREKFLIPTDERGKHENQPSKSEHIKYLIKEHLFKILESPDIFKCSKKNLGDPNMNKLWQDFKEKYGNVISRSTYTKYVHLNLTPDILSKFMCANKAVEIMKMVNNYQNKNAFKKKKLSLT